MSKEVNIVWLKRDIRTQDHAPFFAAEKDTIPYIPIYIFEPSITSHLDSSLRHQQFVYHAIQDVNRQLDKHQLSIELFYTEAHKAFTFLCYNYSVKNVFSYQETGIQKTWDRDKAVKKLLKTKHVNWVEFQRDGIQRSIKNRKGWDKQWYITMKKEPLINPIS